MAPNGGPLIRTPLYPSRGRARELLSLKELRELIPDSELHVAIQMASLDLMSSLAQGRDDKDIEQKVSLYRARSAQRCVPFGAFAQVTVIGPTTTVSSNKTVKIVSSTPRPLIDIDEHIRNTRPLNLIPNASLILAKSSYTHLAMKAGKVVPVSSAAHFEIVSNAYRSRATTYEAFGEPDPAVLEAIADLVRSQTLHVLVEPPAATSSLFAALRSPG